MNKIKEYIKLIRVKHYFKNVLIFLPLIFSGNIFNIEKLIISIIGFIAFSFVASVVYIINDIRDIENDRKHSIKRKLRNALRCRKKLVSMFWYTENSNEMTW